MIATKKSRWFNAWFARHARSRIRRSFGRVLVGGLGRAREAVRHGPVLLVANHTTWWDALVALYASELLLASDGYAMMDAANLRRLPFFGRVGAFGVDLDVPADGARGIRHAAKLLCRPGRTLWIFPEGREGSPFAPLDLRPGAALVARVAKRAVVVPVGLRYTFGGDERPDLWMAFGKALEVERDVANGVLLQRAGIEGELGRIDEALASETGRPHGAGCPAGFEAVMDRRSSLFASIAERVLVRMLPARD